MTYTLILAALAGVIYFLHWKAGELRTSNPMSAKFYAYLNCILVAVWVLLFALALHID